MAAATGLEGAVLSTHARAIGVKTQVHRGFRQNVGLRYRGTGADGVREPTEPWVSGMPLGTVAWMDESKAKFLKRGGETSIEHGIEHGVVLSLIHP